MDFWSISIVTKEHTAINIYIYYFYTKKGHDRTIIIIYFV